MSLSAQQRIVYLKVMQEDHWQMDAKVRAAVDILPDCRILSINMHTYVWGAYVFVLVETI